MHLPFPLTTRRKALPFPDGWVDGWKGGRAVKGNADGEVYSFRKEEKHSQGGRAAGATETREKYRGGCARKKGYGGGREGEIAGNVYILRK